MEFQLQGTTIAERGKCLLDSGLWSDCSFIVGDEKKLLKASRYVLAKCSPVFEAMLYGAMANQDTIELKDTDSDVFYKLLLFSYTQKTDISSRDEAFELCRLAHSYMMPDLVEYCAEYMKPTGNDVWDTLNFATFYNIPSLEQSAIKFVSQKIESHLLKTSVLDRLSPASVAAILKSEDLCVENEISLFNFVVCWAKIMLKKQNETANAESIRKVLNECDIIKHVRFLCLSQETFSTEVVPTGILTPDELSSIYTCITAQNANHVAQTISPLMFRTKIVKPVEIESFSTQNMAEIRSETEYVTFSPENTLTEKLRVHSVPIILLGVTVPTRRLPRDTPEDATYYEALEVQVEDEVGGIKASGSYRGLAPYARSIYINLIFRNPNIIFPLGWIVVIKIKFLETGTYPFNVRSVNLGALQPLANKGFIMSVRYGM